MSTNGHSTRVRHGMLATIAAAMLAGAIAACGVGPANDKDKIATATSTYLQALADGNAAAACAQLSHRSDDDYCPQAVKQQLSHFTPDMLKGAAAASIDINVSGNTATSTLGKPHGARLTVVRTADGWRINSGFTVPRVSSRRRAG